MATPLNVAIDRKLELKAEGLRLLDTSAAQRTPEQRARLDVIDKEAAALDQEIIALRRRGDDDRASASSLPLLAPRAKGRKYADMFAGRVPMDAGGFTSSDEFLATLHSGLADTRLVPSYDPRLSATATEGVSSAGGFSVPNEFFRQWLDSSLESEIVRPRADIRPMLSNTASAAGWDDGDHSSTLYGGFSGEWLDEAGDITPQTAKMRLINLRARKLGILARVSNELIADGVSFEEQLGQAITRALGWFLDGAFLTGNGASKPLGVLNAGCTISVAKETGQAAATINYTNIAKMFARLHPSSYPTAVWVCNSTAIPQLLQLSVAIGTAGSHVPVLSESGGMWRMLSRHRRNSRRLPTQSQSSARRSTLG